MIKFQASIKTQETKKLLMGEKLFGVDPAGLAPASSGANADMLLYALRARIHKAIIKQKKLLLQEVFSVAPDEWHIVPYQRISILTYGSESCQ
jgi:hypothetical protein